MPDPTPDGATRALPDVNLPDIPFERVQAAVKELLDLDSLRNLRSVEIGFDVIRAVVYAVDENGQKFRDRSVGDGMQPAMHVLTRRVVR